MIEELRTSLEELKRVDHLIYVSLKYTRTVDVIKNVVKRLISAMDLGIAALLESLKLQKKIKTYPDSPGQRVELLNKLSPGDGVLADYLGFYLLLRKINKAPYSKREEYRRHVTLIAHLEPQTTIELDIDNLEERYKKTKEFMNCISNIIEGKKDD